jgi:sulfatase modifying factor 1
MMPSGRHGQFHICTLGIVIMEASLARIPVRRVLLFLIPVATVGLTLLGTSPSSADERTAAGGSNHSERNRSLENSIGMKLRLVRPGEFMMGSSLPVEETVKRFGLKTRDFEDEHPRHRVRITKSFYLGVHEVTVGQFRQFVNDTGYKTEPEADGEGGFGFNASTGKFEGWDPKYTWANTGWERTDDHPVVNITWNDAKAFCTWLSRKEGAQYQLPTEAQWEYACRAGTTTVYQHGDNIKGLHLVANSAATKKKRGPDSMNSEDGYVFTAPVGKFKANGFGLQDMHGNVFEWCADWYGKDYFKTSPTSDPAGPESGSRRVVRGGGWRGHPVICRSPMRNGREPLYRTGYIGFRVVRSSAR